MSYGGDRCAETCRRLSTDPHHQLEMISRPAKTNLCGKSTTIIYVDVSMSRGPTPACARIVTNHDSSVKRGELVPSRLRGHDESPGERSRPQTVPTLPPRSLIRANFSQNTTSPRPTQRLMSCIMSTAPAALVRRCELRGCRGCDLPSRRARERRDRVGCPVAIAAPMRTVGRYDQWPRTERELVLGSGQPKRAQ